MEKEFVPYEQALALKELGFDEPCLSKYDNEGMFYNNILNRSSITGQVASPLYQQAFRWFEDNQSMFVERIVITNVNEVTGIEYNIKSWKFTPITIEFNNPYDSFDKNKAELKCLKRLIEIVKNK